MKSSTALPDGPQRGGRAVFSVRGTPMLAAAMCFACGIGLAEWQWLPTGSLVCMVVVCGGLTCVALSRAPRVMLLPLLVMWCGLGWLTAEMEPPVDAHADLVRNANGMSLRLAGSVEHISPIVDDNAADNSDDNATNNSGDVEGQAAVARGAAVQLDVQLNALERLDADADRMAPMTGGVRLVVYGKPGAAVPQFRCGENIAVSAILHEPEKFLDDGAWDYAAYLAQSGINVRTSVNADAVTVAGEARGLHLACRIHAAQTWASERLAAYAGTRANNFVPAAMRVNEQDAGALAAMLFGDRTRLDRTLKSNFVSTGSFHFFVVSGLHIALIAGIVFFLLRRLRVPRTWALVLMLGVTTIYALVTGFGEPVQRALGMTALFVVARLLWRQTPVLNVLGTTALVLLAAAPHLLFDAGLQMTALAVLAITGIAAPLAERSFLAYARATKQLELTELDASLPPRVAQFRVMLRLLQAHTSEALGRRVRGLPVLMVRWSLWAAELLVVSVIVELAMTLPMAVWFHRVPVLALPANLVALPLLMVLAPLGMFSFLMTLVSPWLALLPMTCTAAMLHFAEWFAATLGHLHTATIFYSQLRTPAPTVPATMIALALFFLALVAAGGGWRRWRIPAAVVAPIAIAALVCSAVACLWPTPMVRVPRRLEVTAIDVGQGDSILAVTPDGHTLLVDAGGPIGGPYTHSAADGSVAFDIGEEVVSPYLWSRQVRRLDAVAVTHPHSDHMGGMPAVLRNFQPRELWLGGTLDAPEERLLLQTAAELKIPVRHWTVGARFNFGGLPVRVLWPPPRKVLTARSANNDSLVLELDYGKSRALLEGDAEAPSEAGMLASGALEPVTLLKVAHHGSKTSSTPAFLDAIAPVDAVISVGRENPFGHPKAEVIDSLVERNARLYRTDKMGEVTVLMDADGHATASTFVGR